MVDVEKEVRITLELPGVKKEDVNLTVEGGRLIISVDDPGRNYCREVELPDSVNVDEARSTFSNGILSIVFPKERYDGSGVRVKID